MSYGSRRGNRPAEYASKVSHSHIINDQEVQRFLSNCNLPKKAENITFQKGTLCPYKPIEIDPIRFIIAVDGGYGIDDIPCHHAAYKGVVFVYAVRLKDEL